MISNKILQLTEDKLPERTVPDEPVDLDQLVQFSRMFRKRRIELGKVAKKPCLLDHLTRLFKSKR